MAKRVSIVNFKGGVGKTTLAFHLAAGLARFHGSRVLLVDMDHQSSLSIVCLGAARWNAVAGGGRTVTGIFQSFLGAPLPGKEIVHDSSFGQHGSYSEQVRIAPASLGLDDTEIALTASHVGETSRTPWNKRTLMCRWLGETGVDDEYDYIVFDCAPATKIVTQNAIAASHGYVVPVVPEAVMERGAPHLCAMMKSGIDQRLRDWALVEDARNMFVPETGLVGLVITRIQVAGNARSGYTNDHTQHLRLLRERWGDTLVDTYIQQGTGIGAAMTDGMPVYDRSSTRSVGGRGIDSQFEQLTAELKDRIDRL